MTHPSNYDKYPVVQVKNGTEGCWNGWPSILAEIRGQIETGKGSPQRLVIECYPGVREEEICRAFCREFPDALLFRSSDALRSPEELNAFFRDDLTDDEVFGFLTRHTIECFFDADKVHSMRQQIQEQTRGLSLICGIGAAHLWPDAGRLIYADLSRWEIQQRFRRNEVGNIGVENRTERASLQYKRAFFVDWRVADRFKKTLMQKWDYLLDTHDPQHPKMITAGNFRAGLRQAVSRPFRVVPFFDPGPWGGQWMKEVCDLDRTAVNYAWCFDCVPEENSLLLQFGDTIVEIPAIDLVFAHPEELLGTPVYGRFGDEFPIRFDFLDTMQGGNLSLQVHPSTQYIQEKFGIPYTQDESYYLLDAGDDAVVYLGLKEGVDPDAMIRELKEAQVSGHFDATRHVGVYPVRKHDHLLIPAGTVHCSGKNSMVLEISATPYIFTFKLWDWGRLGLDGRPRPIHVGHGEKVIRWERTESWVKKELVGRCTLLHEEEGIREERTGLHEQEFIETRRHWFSKPVVHHTCGSVNVLNLVEGREVIVESPSAAFDPFVVHYAETFIVPAAVETYTIRPYGASEGKECATLKAFVRHHA